MLFGKQLALAIALISLVTFFTRAFPFLLFDKPNKQPPEIILFLGKYLPPAIICCILVYSFKDVSLLQKPYGLKEITSVLTVVLLHLYKANAMISILGGTFVYIVQTQFLYANF